MLNKLREAFKFFRSDFEQQTKIFEQGTNIKKVRIADNTNDGDKSDLDLVVDRTQARSKDFVQLSEVDFDRSLEGVQKQLEALEKQFLMNDYDYDEAVQWHLGEHMTHSYYLDTISEIKTTRSCFLDMMLIVFTYIWVMAGLHLLREKNYIGNYHSRWVSPFLYNL